MDYEIVKHEVSHLVGAAASFLATHPRYHDAEVTIFSDAKGYGFAALANTESAFNGALSDAQLKQFSATYGLAPASAFLTETAIFERVKNCRYAYDAIKSFSDVLSHSDRIHAVKGSPVDLDKDIAVGLFAYAAMLEVDPQRLKAIETVVARRKGLPLMPLRKLIPRDTAVAVRKAAQAKANALFDLWSFEHEYH